MKIYRAIIIIYLFTGCADLSENPTDISQYQTVPLEVLNIINNNCTFCHQPESFIVFKGQKPYFGHLLPDGNTLPDTLQIWNSRERIGIRVKEGTMPRISEISSDSSLALTGNRLDIIVNWAEGNN